MSMPALKWAWGVKVPPTQKLVLVALAYHMNKDSGKCFPSLTRLQEFTGLSRPAVWQTIDKLVAANFVIRIKKKTRSTFYQLGNGVTHSSGNVNNMVGKQTNRIGNKVNTSGNDITSNKSNKSNSSELGTSPAHVLVHLERLKESVRRK